MTKLEPKPALEKRLGQFASVVLLNGLAINRADSTTSEMAWIGLGRNGPEEIGTTTLVQMISVGIAGGCTASNRFQQIWTVLPRSPGPILQIRWQNLQEQAFNTLPSGHQLAAMNLLYVVGAAHYHLLELLELYRDVALRCLGASVATKFKDDRVVLSGQIEPYFEIEALISAAARSFETARYPLWQSFGRNHSCPSNFAATVDSLELPESLETWRQRWSSYYARLRDYRDCFHHNAHFGARLPFAMGVRVDDYWGLSVRLPDNPESKSYEAFTYDMNIDALSYGWNLVNDVFDFTAETFDAMAGQQL